MHTIDQKKSKKYENASSKAPGYPPGVSSKTSRRGLQEPTRSRRRLSTKNNEERKEQQSGLKLNDAPVYEDRMLKRVR